MKKSAKFSPEVRERAVRIKDLERENRKLRRANEILKLASAFFAQAELDCRIVGWHQSSSMHTDFVLDALEQALYDRKPSEGMDLSKSSTACTRPR